MTRLAWKVGRVSEVSEASHDKNVPRRRSRIGRATSARRAIVGAFALAGMGVLTFAGAQSYDVLVDLEPKVRDAIDFACRAEQLSGNRAMFTGCVDRQLAQLEASEGFPDLSGVPIETLEVMESACASSRYTAGVVGYARCLRREAEALADGGSGPDLSQYDALTRELIDNACASQRYAGGVSGYRSCIAFQLEALEAQGGIADLSGLATDERDLVESACLSERAVGGPAGYARCLRTQLSALEAVGGLPDLSELDSQQRASLRAQCQSVRYVGGPARYAKCLRRILDRDVQIAVAPDMTGLTSAARAQVEYACLAQRYDGDPNSYAICLTREVARLPASARQAPVAPAPVARAEPAPAPAATQPAQTQPSAIQPAAPTQSAALAPQTDAPAPSAVAPSANTAAGAAVSLAPATDLSTQTSTSDRAEPGAPALDAPTVVASAPAKRGDDVTPSSALDIDRSSDREGQAAPAPAAQAPTTETQAAEAATPASTESNDALAWSASSIRLDPSNPSATQEPQTVDSVGAPSSAAVDDTDRASDVVLDRSQPDAADAPAAREATSALVALLNDSAAVGDRLGEAAIPDDPNLASPNVPTTAPIALAAIATPNPSSDVDRRTEQEIDDAQGFGPPPNVTAAADLSRPAIGGLSPVFDLSSVVDSRARLGASQPVFAESWGDSGGVSLESLASLEVESDFNDLPAAAPAETVAAAPTEETATLAVQPLLPETELAPNAAGSADGEQIASLDVAPTQQNDAATDLSIGTIELAPEAAPAPEPRRGELSDAPAVEAPDEVAASETEPASEPVSRFAATAALKPRRRPTTPRAALSAPTRPAPPAQEQAAQEQAAQEPPQVAPQEPAAVGAESSVAAAPRPAAPAPAVAPTPQVELNQEAALERQEFGGSAPADDGEAIATGAPNLSSDGLLLLGILSGGGRDRALVGTANGGALRVKPGDSIGGWTVKEIGDASVLLTRGGASEELRLP